MAKPEHSGFQNPAETWNSRFAHDDFLFGTAPNEWLREQAAVLPKNSRILSVADGEGRNSVWLAGQGHQVDAFDIAEVGVAKARTLAAASRVLPFRHRTERQPKGGEGHDDEGGGGLNFGTHRQ